MSYYPNLINEICEKNVPLSRLANSCKVSNDRMADMILGVETITLTQALIIKRAIPSGLPLEDLFATREGT